MANKLKSVAILFKAAVREEIKAASAIRGIELPADFDTVGQQFENVIEYNISDGTVDVVCPSRENENETVVYSYPLTDISRVRGVFAK